MSSRPKRKLVLVIVEGYSDMRALEPFLSELYDNKYNDSQLFFLLQNKEGEKPGGDITTEIYSRDRYGHIIWVTKDNIVKAINERILDAFFDAQKVYPKDIYEIVQIVDTDGAFIPEDSIVFNPVLTAEESPLYFRNRIECVNVDNIKYRNIRKSQTLIYLSGISRIKVRGEKIPYSIYFFSSNLDHYLFDNPNLNKLSKKKISKVKKAIGFSNRYYGDLQGFVNFFSKGKETPENTNYEKSWGKIRIKKNSLRKNTNINILLSRLIDSDVSKET